MDSVKLMLRIGRNVRFSAFIQRDVHDIPLFVFVSDYRYECRQVLARLQECAGIFISSIYPTANG